MRGEKYQKELVVKVFAIKTIIEQSSASFRFPGSKLRLLRMVIFSFIYK